MILASCARDVISFLKENKKMLSEAKKAHQFDLQAGICLKLPVESKSPLSSIVIFGTLKGDFLPYPIYMKLI